MNSAPVSLVIPISGKGPFREANLYATLRSLHGQECKPEEIIIVEQSVTTNKEELPYWASELQDHVTRYIHIQDEPLCVPWMKNVGIYAATQDIIVVSDADVIFPTDYFKVLMSEFRPELGFMQGYNRAYNLNVKGRALYFLSGYWPTSPDLAVEMIPSKYYPGYLHIYDKTFVREKLGGYNENMVEYCPADKDITTRAAEFVKRKRYQIPTTILHVYHRATWQEVRRKRIRTPLNRQLLTHTCKHPMEVSALLAAADLGNPDHRTPMPYELDI